MTNSAPEIPVAGAGQAFVQLCGEVSLLRRAIEGLTAERQAAPDYGPTLDAIDDSMTQFVSWARRVAETPMLKMTPEMFEREIASVAQSAGQFNRETIERSQDSMTAAIKGVQQVTESARKASDQNRALLIAAGISAVMGIVLTLALVRLFSSSNAVVPVFQTAPAHVTASPAAPPRSAPAARHRRHVPLG